VVDVPATLDAIATIAELLTQRGPLHKDEITRHLRDRGMDDPDSTIQWNLLEMDCPARHLVDARWVWLPVVLAGRVFTHTVSADEATHDVLTVTPDLDPITTLCEHEQYQRFADGSAVRVVLAGYDDDLLEERGIPAEVTDWAPALLLGPGTLAALGVGDGDTVGLRLTADGIVLERVDVIAQHTAGVRLAATLETDEPTYVDAAVWTACVADAALFTDPLPPLSEIVDRHGLARRGEWIAPSGFDFSRWQFERRCELLAERHGLDVDHALALAALVELYDQMSRFLIEADDVDEADEGPSAEPADHTLGVTGELGAQLADPLMAELLVAETVDSDGSAAALGLFAETMEPRVPRAARVAWRWLRAVALERIGDIEEAEQELLAAESMDPDWPLPLIDLARIASDRGDVERGLALLRRAGAEPDDPLVVILEAHRVEPRSDLGRNEPCWCRSGRKYKKCHLGREQLALAERVNWLYEKAAQYVDVAGWRDLLAEVAYERYRHTHDLSEALAAGMADPVVMDVVLFEGGAFAEFLEVRGSLLPDDERLLAEQWLLVDRSVFEVEMVNRGESVTVRDVRNGDVHEVRERTASRMLKPAQLICARVVSAGDSMQFFGGLEPIALHERDPLIELLDSEPDPVELMDALSRRFAPATLTNTEGEPLAICETTVRLGDPERVETALDDVYDRANDDEPPRWHEHVTTHGMLRIRAVLVREGDTLRVETNSAERMDRVLATLVPFDPAMRVVDDSRHPIRDAREAAELAAQLPDREGALDPENPEVAEMLDEFIREYEAKWLDEPIPALDGHTPRQAADDPTRRGDLIKLLDSFPADDGAPGRMSAERLRVALGLE
jgi:tetratricopeptide (TPR) repeat protein